MKWFDNWFARQSKKAWENSKQYNVETDGRDMSTITVSGINGISAGIAKQTYQEQRLSYSNSAMNFKVYPAEGGWVVEVTNQTASQGLQIRDVSNETKLYIVTNEEDLGQRIGHILTVEALKR